jgi:hypothetical protein
VCRSIAPCLDEQDGAQKKEVAFGIKRLLDGFGHVDVTLAMIHHGIAQL